MYPTPTPIYHLNCWKLYQSENHHETRTPTRKERKNRSRAHKYHWRKWTGGTYWLTDWLTIGQEDKTSQERLETNIEQNEGKRGDSTEGRRPTIRQDKEKKEYETVAPSLLGYLLNSSLIVMIRIDHHISSSYSLKKTRHPIPKKTHIS